ncbi:ecto-ADP-ribosyltransferase 3 isoform X2 [Psammomys obesus]|uniref:ecto-ADP-ribosyltransferase 3 isoform X2 n=1 Tax=Psammomys obesus TaxID=48139 RepID=UPI00245319B5|nr:ecto-ADP-ribosyltransferase 3 isoform X2 [Psammomys obesus]
MKMGHFEMVTTLLAATVLMDIFQVKAEGPDVEATAFDDEYRKCGKRMEVKYALQLLREEIADDDLLRVVWGNAEVNWEKRKAQILYPPNFKDPYGVALMAYVTEASQKSVFYHTFNRAVQRAGQSRQDYIYDFQFKSFHFYLVRALQLLRRPCEESYKNVVYSTSPNISFTIAGRNQARLGECTLASSTRPLAVNNQQVLTIRTCFGVPVDRFLQTEGEEVVLIPPNEVFQVSRDGTGNELILQSTNKTCSYFECSFLGGLKAENCLNLPELSEPVYVYNPVSTGGDSDASLSAEMDKQKLEDTGRKSLRSTKSPGIKVLQPDGNSLLPDGKPGPGPDPVPGPKTHPSASSGKRLLPSVTASIILTVASAVNFLALELEMIS